MATIAIGNDHAGYALKLQLMEMLKDEFEFTDYGCYSAERYDYPDAAEAVATAIKEGKHERGILICGSGIGISIAANKVPGIRAAACQSFFAAKYCRLHNDAQIICLGERITGPGEAAIAAAARGAAVRRPAAPVQSVAGSAAAAAMPTEK